MSDLAIDVATAELTEVIRTELPYWAKVIKEAGIKGGE